MELSVILFTGIVFVTALVFYFIGRLVRHKEMQKHRTDAVNRSRSVLKGQISEQLAPYFPGFDFDTSECRFIGKPIDFIVFKGMKEGEISEVVFVEVKTGKSGLSRVERSLKEAIEAGRVSWSEFRIDL